MRVSDARFPLHWRKARASANGGGNCVEVALAGSTVLVRNSRHPAGPVLAFTVEGWDAFIRAARSDQFGGRGDAPRMAGHRRFPRDDRNCLIR